VDALSFGKNMTREDIQGVVRTCHIQQLTLTGDDITNNLKVTSAAYDFSQLPVISTTNDWDEGVRIAFTIKKRVTPPAGTGIVGQVRFRIFDVANSVVARVKTKISRLFQQMRGNSQLDFGQALKNELSQFGISQGQIKATLSKIEVVSRDMKLNSNQELFVYGNKHNQASKLPSGLLPSPGKATISGSFQWPTRAGFYSLPVRRLFRLLRRIDVDHSIWAFRKYDQGVIRRRPKNWGYGLGTLFAA